MSPKRHQQLKDEVGKQLFWEGIAEPSTNSSAEDEYEPVGRANVERYVNLANITLSNA